MNTICTHYGCPRVVSPRHCANFITQDTYAPYDRYYSEAELLLLISRKYDLTMITIASTCMYGYLGKFRTGL